MTAAQTLSPAAPHGLTNAALNGEDLLRLLARQPHGHPFASQSEIAKAAGRAPKNIGRDLGQLENADLIRAPGVDHGEWSSSALTDAGWDALTALDRASGRGGGLIHVPPAMLDDNPLNPRQSYDPAALESLADTIEADGRIIEPLVVSPVQPNGRRVVWAGHRRKRAVMIVEARFTVRGEPLPPGLADGVPCIERTATPAESLFIAVVENGARENLTPWEDAKALAALSEATGWSGRELARRTGRAPRLADGDETGVRDTQEKIKVARTAPAELVQAHEAGAITWEQLRGALRTGRLPDAPSEGDAQFPADAAQLRDDAPDAEPEQPALTLNVNQRLALLEIAHAGRFHPDRMVVGEGEDQVAYAATGKYWLDLTASTLQTLRLIDFKHHGRPYVRLTPTGLAWMVENIGTPLDQALQAARQEAAPALDWHGPGYITDWLNPLPPEEAPPPAASPVTDATEAQTIDVEDAVAARLLEDAMALADLPDPGSTSYRNLLARSGVAGPFVTGAEAGVVFDAAGESVFVVDVDNQLPDDTARARAVVIAAALNRACGYQTTEAQ